MVGADGEMEERSTKWEISHHDKDELRFLRKWILEWINMCNESRAHGHGVKERRHGKVFVVRDNANWLRTKYLCKIMACRIVNCNYFWTVGTSTSLDMKRAPVINIRCVCSCRVSNCTRKKWKESELENPLVCCCNCMLHIFFRSPALFARPNGITLEFVCWLLNRTAPTSCGSPAMC